MFLGRSCLRCGLRIRLDGHCLLRWGVLGCGAVALCTMLLLCGLLL